jgi:hypothetical protein
LVAEDDFDFSVVFAAGSKERFENAVDGQCHFSAR